LGEIMPYFKDINGHLHFLDSADFAYLLPPGSVAITDAEAAAIVAANTPESGPIVPASISRRQGRLALLGAGLLDAVEAAIAAIPDATERRAAEINY
jgi:hypothetical protein